MVNLNLRSHPHVIFAYTPNFIELIMKVENTGGQLCWMEADIALPERLSLGPDNALQKGRLRLGIIGRDESFEKTVRIYANNYTKPHMYRCKVVVYTYSRDGVIDKRLEKPVDIRCEMKKAPVL